MIDYTPAELVHRALFGMDDEDARKRFIEHFGDLVRQFETNMTSVYEGWVEFDKTFMRDQDIETATVVGTIFAFITRLILSMRLLMVGHITLAGATMRQAVEAIALTLLFSKYGLPYLREAWEDRFSVHKAIDILYKNRKKLKLNKEALQVMKNNRDFYHKFSHSTILAMNDMINMDGSGIYLGASFDEAKLPFYEKEVTSRVNLSKILVNVIEGVTRQMREWPCFAEKRHTS